MLPAVVHSFFPRLPLSHYKHFVAEEISSLRWWCIVPLTPDDQTTVLFCSVRLTVIPKKLGYLSSSRPKPLWAVSAAPFHSKPEVAVVVIVRNKVIEKRDVMCAADGSKLGVVIPTVFLSFIPVLGFVDVDVFSKSSREAEQEEDAGERLMHLCVVSKSQWGSCSWRRWIWTFFVYARWWICMGLALSFKKTHTAVFSALCSGTRCSWFEILKEAETKT